MYALRTYFLASARGFETHRVCHNNKKNILCHPSHPTVFFATQILGGHVTSRNKGLSSNDQGRQRRETLGTRLLLQGMLRLSVGTTLELVTRELRDLLARLRASTDLRDKAMELILVGKLHGKIA